MDSSILYRWLASGRHYPEVSLFDSFARAGFVRRLGIAGQGHRALAFAFAVIVFELGG